MLTKSSSRLTAGHSRKFFAEKWLDTWLMALTAVASKHAYSPVAAYISGPQPTPNIQPCQSHQVQSARLYPSPETMYSKLVVCFIIGMVAIQMSAALPTNCTLEPAEGNCRAHIERYYYDITAAQCQLFIYGGCQGNGNNFETVEACQATCV
ncbi:hypothetical protein BsWGS_07377 [Bradybaena similaris]